MKSRFHELATEWREATAEDSSLKIITTHPAYLDIIGMGTAVLPLILEDLDASPTHWFAALYVLTGGEKPQINPEDRGRLSAMAKAWVNWGVQRGIIPPRDQVR